MASGKILRQLIKTGSTGDSEGFRQASEAIIQEERMKQHHLLANDLEKVLYGEHQKPHIAPLGLRERIPVDQERGLPLLALKEPVRSLEEIVLSKENLQVIESILLEHHRGEVLKTYGMRPVDRMLFFGPPGCGKTMMAEVLATELSLPLALIRLDSVVSSYLGATAANLRKVFDFIEATPMIALFDEFDALGKERADASEHGELKRVVNAVLQMLDAYQGRSLIIAATNHEGMLDSAIWRRFEEVLVFGPPTPIQINQFLQIKLRGVRRNFELEDKQVLPLLKGLSYADAERVLRRAIKEMILSGEEFLELRHLKKAHQRESIRIKRLVGTS